MPSGSNSRTLSGVPRPKPNCISSRAKKPPAAMLVPAGMT